ncbi:hypothetical protein [Roseobacter litoralis]|uniref:hypothetical protein n=1 Tax=Roseobacter litoralis TaxID=42443 RepID=UPI002494E9D8|nr:hypothetical protein [Roseobacter litoralis]
MYRFLTTATLMTVCTAVPALSEQTEPASCQAKFQTVAEAWAASKASEEKSVDVMLPTDDGAMEVTAEDAGPTENWMGTPPSGETIDGYLTAAEDAMSAGDDDACLAHLEKAENAMTPTTRTEGGE